MNKRRIAIFFVLVIFLFPRPMSVAGETVESGVEYMDGKKDTTWFTTSYEGYDAATKTYTLYTAEQVAALPYVISADNDFFAGLTVRLGADVAINVGNASSWSTEAPGYLWEPIANFKGTFDGNGHFISGLYATGKSAVGMFAQADGAAFQNLSLVNSYFEASDGPVAALVSQVVDHPCSFENLYSNAVIVGNYNGGGFVGRFQEDCSTLIEEPSDFTACVFAGSVTVNQWPAGGIAGNLNGATVRATDCLNAGSVSAGAQYGAGILGRATASDIALKNCVSLGQINPCPAAGTLIGDGAQGAIRIENCVYLRGIMGESNAPIGQPVACSINGSEETASDGLCFEQALAALGQQYRDVSAYEGQGLIDGWKAVENAYPCPTESLAERIAAIGSVYADLIEKPESKPEEPETSGDSDTATEETPTDNTGTGDGDGTSTPTSANTETADAQGDETGCSSSFMPSLASAALVSAVVLAATSKRKHK